MPKTLLDTVADPLVDQEAADLEQIITVLDTLYESGEPCVNPFTGELVTDQVYDGMRKRLAEIKPTSFVFEQVTASQLETTSRKVKHDPPMSSIHKANGSLVEKDAIRKQWLTDIWNELKYPGSIDDHFNVSLYITQSYKVDGVACSIIYKKGKLYKAGLRPRNGIDGEDVTANVKYVEGVPEKLSLPIDVIVRGELFCPKSVFENKNKELEAKGEKTFANPRNYTAGSIRQFKDPSITGDRGIHFRAYTLLGWKDGHKHYQTEYERAVFCSKELKIPHVRVERHNYGNLKEMEERAKLLDYEVDGVVLSVNDIESQQQMGTHGGSPDADPRGKLAWKFEEEHADCLVKKIIWNTGRTRKITPVANFDGVKLAGTTVTNCTLHSLGLMRRKKIDAGTVIRVIKSGKIIPFVQEVVSGYASEPGYPQNCPSCGSATQVEESHARDDQKYTADVICSNAMCGASAVSQLLHFLMVLGFKGLGESAVQILYDKKYVRTWSDFFKLDKNKLLEAGFSERETILNLCRLRMIDQPEQVKDSNKLYEILAKSSSKLKFPLWQIFASLGISGAGKSVGRALESKYDSLEKIMDANADQMTALDGIGTITANTIHDFFTSNKNLVEELLEYIDVEGPKTGKFSGITFCMSGSFENGKDYWEKRLTEEGATVSGSVSKKVKYLVAGPGSGSKSQKAFELNISIINENDLKKMLE